MNFTFIGCDDAAHPCIKPGDELKFVGFPKREQKFCYLADETWVNVHPISMAGRGRFIFGRGTRGGACYRALLGRFAQWQWIDADSFALKACLFCRCCGGAREKLPSCNISRRKWSSGRGCRGEGFQSSDVLYKKNRPDLKGRSRTNLNKLEGFQDLRFRKCRIPCSPNGRTNRATVEGSGTAES